MNKQQVVNAIIASRKEPVSEIGKAYAPANIALCKYWGKRNGELNLPMTSSLSVSLAHLGTTTAVTSIRGRDEIILNGLKVPDDTSFSQRLCTYLDLFRCEPDAGFRVVTANTIPTAAGLASSASGFAALAKALDILFDWHLDPSALSILARLGSGSASRSIFEGFVEWQAGSRDDGMDSRAVPLTERWPNLMVGLVKISTAEKPIGSREAMKQTVDSSILYRAWPDQVMRDLAALRDAMTQHDFHRLGQTAENNALAMHATALAAWPPTLFWWPESVKAMHLVWALRREGVAVYFTMDAGPNLKLLAEKSSLDAIVKHFPSAEWVEPFADRNVDA